MILIAGPTASGKSALALACARRLGAWVVNADSMQVYRDLSILTARPAAEDLEQAPHRLYGHVPAERPYSVGAYLTDLSAVIAQAGARPLVIVGGTGLYFRAMTEGLVETPHVADHLHAHWREAAARGVDLHAALTKADPDLARTLSPADLPRLQRALAVFDGTGVPLSVWRQRRPGRPLLPSNLWHGLFLVPDRRILADRIAQRFHAMMAAGALDEVARLQRLGLPANTGIMKAHGLPHLLAHLEGRLGWDAAVAAAIGDTRRYAKRQMTWARRFMGAWTWVESSEVALAALSGTGSTC